MRRWLGVALAFACCALSAVAHGQERTGPALNWTRQPGAESCVASVELAARIEARVKRKIFVAAPEAIVAVEGYVAPDPAGGFRASIAMSDGQGVLYGSRELATQGPCSELTDGLVFVIAVTLRPEGGASGIELPESVADALDALFGAEPSEPDPAAFPSQPAPAVPSGTPEAASREPAAPSSASAVRDDGKRTLYVEALGIAQLGLQPVGSLGGGLGARVRIGGAGSFSASGALLAESAETVDSGGRARFTGALVSIGYCTPSVWERGVLALEACAAARVGSMTAEGSGFDAGNDEPASSTFGSLGLAARLAWSPAPLIAVALSAGPELHVARPVFAYAVMEGAAQRELEVFKTSLIGGAAELSVAFALF